MMQSVLNIMKNKVNIYFSSYEKFIKNWGDDKNWPPAKKHLWSGNFF